MAKTRLKRRIIANPRDPLPTGGEGGEFRSHALRLPPEAAGLRLDQALARQLPQYSRARLKSWIDEGAVELDGHRLRAKDRVLGGEAVRIEAHLPPLDAAQAEALPLDVVFEDRALILVNKPAGMVVHPGAGNARHTLQNALLALDPRLALLPRGGLVHRLDKDTSGLLLVARTLEAHTALVAALAARQIKREYLALCTGVMTGGGTVDEPIGRHRGLRTRMAVRADGRAAVTHYRRPEALPRPHPGARHARDRAHAPDPRAPAPMPVSRSSATRSTADDGGCRPARPRSCARRSLASSARHCTRRASSWPTR